MATKKTIPSWSGVKTKLADFDRAGLIGPLQDLYAASKDNQAFLQARFALGDDVPKEKDEPMPATPEDVT